MCSLTPVKLRGSRAHAAPVGVPSTCQGLSTHLFLVQHLLLQLLSQLALLVDFLILECAETQNNIIKIHINKSINGLRRR